MLSERYLKLANLWCLLENRQTADREELLHIQRKLKVPYYRVWEGHAFLYYKTGGYINTVKVSKHQIHGEMHTAWFKKLKQAVWTFFKVVMSQLHSHLPQTRPQHGFLFKDTNSWCWWAAMPAQADQPQQTDNMGRALPKRPNPIFQVFPQSFSSEHLTPKSTVIVTEISHCQMGAPFKTPKCKQSTVLMKCQHISNMASSTVVLFFCITVAISRCYLPFICWRKFTHNYQLSHWIKSNIGMQHFN